LGLLAEGVHTTGTAAGTHALNGTSSRTEVSSRSNSSNECLLLPPAAYMWQMEGTVVGLLLLLP
jgi:hypothetical protein